MTIATSEKLAQILELNCAPQWMIDAARRGDYDNCKSELAFPLCQLVANRCAFGRPPCKAPLIVTHNRGLRYSSKHTELRVYGVTLTGGIKQLKFVAYCGEIPRNTFQTGGGKISFREDK